MSSKNRIAVLLFIALASLGLWLYLHNREGTIPKELFDFEVEDTASVTKIYMVNNTGKEITLEKKSAGDMPDGHGGWQLNGKYKARTDAVKNLLACMKDLKVRQPVANSAIETVSKTLATSGTKVEIYAGENLIKKYYVGNDTQDGLGTFMLLSDVETGENSSRPFIMFIPGFNGFLSIRYFMDEDLWRDRTVFAFYPDEISSISVRYTRLPDSSFTVALSDKNEISVSDSKGNLVTDFDTLKAKRYITYYTNINYEALNNDLRKSFKDSVLAKGAVHIITLKERNGKVHIVKTYSKPANPDKLDPVTGTPDPEDLEKMFAIRNNEKDIMLIQYYVFGKLFVSSDWFRK